MKRPRELSGFLASCTCVCLMELRMFSRPGRITRVKFRYFLFCFRSSLACLSWTEISSCGRNGQTENDQSLNVHINVLTGHSCPHLPLEVSAPSQGAVPPTLRTSLRQHMRAGGGVLWEMWRRPAASLNDLSNILKGKCSALMWIHSKTIIIPPELPVKVNALGTKSIKFIHYNDESLLDTKEDFTALFSSAFN